MPHFFKILSFNILLIVNTSLYADDLLSIYKQSLLNDAELGIADATYLSKSEVLPQVRSQLLPNIFFTAYTSDERRVTQGNIPTDRFNTHGYTISLRQPIFRLDRWFDLKSAKALTKQAEIEFSTEQQTIILRVAEAYFNILRAEENLVFAKAEAEAVKRQLEQIEQRFEVGLSAITDVYEAQASYDVITVNLITAESDLAISYEVLEKFTGKPQQSISILNEKFPIIAPEPTDQETWVKTAQSQNLSIKAAEYAATSAKNTVKKQRSTHLPTIDAYANYNHNVQGGVSFLGNKNDNRSIGLELTIPIFQGGLTSSNVRAAHYDLQRAQKTLELSKRTTTQETRRLFRLVNTDLRRIKAQKKLIKSSESALEATQIGYEVGTRNAVDVLQSQRDLYNAKRNYANVRYDFILNSLRLKKIVGSLSPQDLVHLNEWLVLSIYHQKNHTSSILI